MVSQCLTSAANGRGGGTGGGGCRGRSCCRGRGRGGRWCCGRKD